MERLLLKLAEHFQLTPEKSRLLIVGLGATGFSAARFLHQTPIRFAVIDSRPHPPLIDDLREELPDTPVFVGGFNQAAFEVATHILASPGAGLHEAAIRKAEANGAVIIGDIDLFMCATERPVIALTGTYGKGMTSAILAEMAAAVGLRPALGGHFAAPALDLLRQEADVSILRLTNMQLERTRLLNARAAAVLNVSPDHVGGPELAALKRRIFQGDGVMVLNADDPAVIAMRTPERRHFSFSVKQEADFYLRRGGGPDCLMFRRQTLLRVDETRLEGLPHIANALAALALAHAMGWDLAAVCGALRNFKGLPHSMQKVAEVDGVLWVNDAKSTSAQACIAALENYDRKVILIAGAAAEVEPPDLAVAVKARTKALILFGEKAGGLAAAVGGALPVIEVSNVRAAVRQALRLAAPGDVVLLAPACRDNDRRTGYAETGNKFIESVLECAPC